MICHSTRFRTSSLATLFALSIASAGIAGPTRTPRVAGQHNDNGNAMHQQAMAMQHQHAAMMRNQNGYGNNNNNNQANAPLVSALHSTMIHLTQADHDYNGHRARAIHEIHTAIRHLNPQAAQASQMNLGANRANRTGNGNGLGNGSNGNGNGQRMPQAMSDAHLREAHQSLMAIHSQMINNGGNAQHHAQAMGSVQRAIQELNVALNVK